MKKNKIKSIALLCGVLGVLVIMTIYFCLLYLDNEDNSRLNKTSEGEFTIIVLPDTQKYSQDYPEIFSSQTQWIVDNKDELNIKFVIHEGDIVDDSNEIEQWNNANESLSILDENSIPYSVIRGNHDKGTELYKGYFPASRFSDESWWGGEHKNNTNNFQLLTIGEKEFLFINLDVCPEEDEIKWADEVLKNYSNRKAILTTHAYLDDNAERNVHVCNNTEYIWDLIKKHENLQIVLCGHVHAEAQRTDLNDAGKKVHQLLADYQDEENGGNGWLRILQFSPKEDKIYAETYSPYLKAYQTDEDSEFVLDYEL